MTRSFKMLGEVEHSLLTGRPRRRFIIPDVLPTGPCFLYGASGSGKTGIAVRTAVAIAAGLQWADRAVQQGSVLYIAGEDFDGVQERLVAAAIGLGKKAADVPLAVIEPHAEGLVSTSFALQIEAEGNALAGETNMSVALVVIDTLGACFGDESQDDARPASKVTGNIDRISRRLACPVLALHHTGKRGSDMRGSQVFFDRADAVIRASHDRGHTTFLDVEKLRNGPGGARFCFTIDAVDVATSDGAISVQVVRDLRAIEPAAIETAGDQKARRQQTDADAALGILHRLAREGAASNAEWQSACYAMWSGRNDNARRAAFSKARTKLKADGQVTIDGDIVAVTVAGNIGNTSPVTPSHHAVAATVAVSPLKGRRSNGNTGLAADDQLEVPPVPEHEDIGREASNGRGSGDHPPMGLQGAKPLHQPPRTGTDG